MARTLNDQARELERVMAELVKKYQFRDRNETVAYGLSVSQAYALRTLHERGPLPMGEVAADLRLSVSTLTRVVDQLVRKGLVERVREEEDRRICRVRLTARGAALWRRLQAELVDGDREVLRGISARDRELVIRVIRELSSAVDRWRMRRAEEGG